MIPAMQPPNKAPRLAQWYDGLSRPSLVTSRISTAAEGHRTFHARASPCVVPTISWLRSKVERTEIAARQAGADKDG